MEMAGVEPAS